MWSQEPSKTARNVLVSNRTYWHLHRVLKTDRKCCTKFKPVHWDGKQGLGMGDCQLGIGERQIKPSHFVSAVYNALVRQLTHDSAPK